MELIESEQYEYAGKEFTIKLFSTDQGFHAVGFLDGTQVTCAWSVSHDTNLDMLMQNKMYAKDILSSGVRSEISRAGRSW